MDSERPPRVLAIRPGAIGDCILWLPSIRYLKTEELEVWAPTPLVTVMSGFAAARPISATGIDLVGVGDLEMPAALRRRLLSFQSIVSWYGANRPEFRDALVDVGVPCEFHAALPPADYPGHATDFFLGQLGGPLGAVPRVQAHSVRRRTIVIHPFSGSAKKNWPMERYRELSNLLPRFVEWTAGPEEELPEATRYGNLMELADWISGADLYIGNDSGVTHLAAATGTPTLALFGPTSPERWAPRGNNVSVLHHQPLEQLTVTGVLNEANRLLGWR